MGSMLPYIAAPWILWAWDKFHQKLHPRTEVLEHLRHSARSAMRDVFFFDNGDINDGTGLSASAEDHVEYLAPVLRSAKYDALNVGNHELLGSGND